MSNFYTVTHTLTLLFVSVTNNNFYNLHLETENGEETVGFFLCGCLHFTVEFEAANLCLGQVTAYTLHL